MEDHASASKEMLFRKVAAIRIERTMKGRFMDNGRFLKTRCIGLQDQTQLEIIMEK